MAHEAILATLAMSSLQVRVGFQPSGSHADRLFWSILDTWKSVTSLSADVKELTPEFYSTDPAFLLNLEEINFGTRAAGSASSYELF